MARAFTSTRGHCFSGMFRWTLFSRVVVFVLVTSVEPVCGFSTETDRIKPCPEIQEAIQRLLDTSDKEEFSAQLEGFRKRHGPHYQQLIPQLFYYSMGDKGQERRHDIKEAMAFGMIAQQLEFSNGNIFNALIPYLNTDDESLRRAIENVFGGFENTSSGRPPDFSLYYSRIWRDFRKGMDPPDGLIRYMYERNPGTALLTMNLAARLDRNESRQITWAEHVISDVIWKHTHKFLKPHVVEPVAAEQLAKLSRSKNWWARLYVAEIMCQHEGFRQPEIIQRLKKDDHPLVRKAMGFETEETQP